jgi:hypothetical protein
MVFDFEVTGFMNNYINNKSGWEMDELKIKGYFLVMGAASPFRFRFFDS